MPNADASKPPEPGTATHTGPAAQRADDTIAPQRTLAGAGPARRPGSETIMMFARPKPDLAAPGPPAATATAGTPPGAAPATTTPVVAPTTSSAAFDITVKAPSYSGAAGSRPVPERTIAEALPAGLRAAAAAATSPPAADATIAQALPLPEDVDQRATDPSMTVPPTSDDPLPAIPTPVHTRTVTPTLADPPPGAEITDRGSGRVSGSVRTEASGRTSGAIPAWAISPDDGADLGTEPPAASPVHEFGALLRRAFAIYADALKPLLILTAAILGPPTLVAVGLTAAFVAVVPNAGLLALNFVLTFLVLGAAWPLCTAAVAITVISYWKGQPYPPRAIGDLLRRQARPLALALLPVGVAIALGYLLFVIPGILAQVFFALVPTVVLLEGHQGGAALKRSATLIRDMLAPTVAVLIGFGL
ncbi:MAG TPA: hypothetical protein VGG33_20720, partial [Polyangia bacterium]